MTAKVVRVAAMLMALGAAPMAFAQSSGTSSPGVSGHNDSETGVAVPGDAPVDSRTLKPAQIGTASTSASAEAAEKHEGTGAGAPAYTDLTQGSSSSSDTTKSE